MIPETEFQASLIMFWKYRQSITNASMYLQFCFLMIFLIYEK